VDDNQKQLKKVKKTRGLFISKKWLIIGVMSIVVAIVCAAIYWYFFVNSISKNQDTSKSPSLSPVTAQETQRTKEVNSVADNANAKLSSGGTVNEATKLYQDAINSTEDITTKASLQLSEATLYFNQGNYDLALEAALFSESNNKNDNIEQFIAQIYDSKGDKLNAAKYYKSAISLVDKTQPFAESKISYYEGLLEAVNAE